MRYKRGGFTIIESLTYIFLTTMILIEGINLFVPMYKLYLETTNLSVKYNDFQNFFINLDNIIAEGNLEKIVVGDNSIIFSKNSKADNLDKKIKSYGGKILVKCTRYDETEAINTILNDVDRLEVRKKGKLVYFIIYDKDGKEFIKCI
jgi:hypothetical protein